MQSARWRNGACMSSCTRLRSAWKGLACPQDLHSTPHERGNMHEDIFQAYVWVQALCQWFCSAWHNASHQRCRRSLLYVDLAWGSIQCCM